MQKRVSCHWHLHGGVLSVCVGFRGVCTCAFPSVRLKPTQPRGRSGGFCCVPGFVLNFFFFSFSFLDHFSLAVSLPFPTPNHLQTGDGRKRGKPGRFHKDVKQKKNMISLHSLVLVNFSLDQSTLKLNFRARTESAGRGLTCLALGLIPCDQQNHIRWRTPVIPTFGRIRNSRLPGPMATSSSTREAKADGSP